MRKIEAEVRTYDELINITAREEIAIEEQRERIDMRMCAYEVKEIA